MTLFSQTGPTVVASLALLAGLPLLPLHGGTEGAHGASVSPEPDVPSPVPSCSEAGSYYCNQYDPDWDCWEDGIWFQNACNDETRGCDGEPEVE